MVTDDRHIFGERYKKHSFKYADLLLPALNDQGLKVIHSQSDENSLLPCRHYFRIYAIRTKRLTEYYADAPELLADMTALRDELEKTPDDLVNLWLFTLPEGKTFSIFENVTNRTILGGFISYDNNSSVTGNA